MPRTTTVECTGCPPIRALTTDEIGFLKVVESRENPVGTPKVVETWGYADRILLASMPDHKSNPVVAVARKSGLVEFLDALNGNVLTSDKVAEAFSENSFEDGNNLAALHLFRRRIFESGLNTFLLCTEKGKACLRSIDLGHGYKKSTNAHTMKEWEIRSGGNILCSSVDGLESHALFGGKGVEVNLWDLETCGKIWTAKSPPSKNLGIFTPTWFTASSFLCKEDHRKIVAGTNCHQVRLYDTSAQRRPVRSLDFRDSSIRAIAVDPDEWTTYIGTGKGDLASFDMRTGKLLGCFLGKCSGSIRSIARHPKLPIIASCGLDRYLRFWDTKSRQLLSSVFLKQNLTGVMLDANFSGDAQNGSMANVATVINDSKVEVEESHGNDERSAKKSKKGKRKKKTETNLPKMEEAEGDLRDVNPQTPLQEEGQLRRPKHKRRKKPVESNQ